MRKKTLSLIFIILIFNFNQTYGKKETINNAIQFTWYAGQTIVGSHLTYRFCDVLQRIYRDYHKGTLPRKAPDALTSVVIISVAASSCLWDGLSGLSKIEYKDADDINSKFKLWATTFFIATTIFNYIYISS